MHSPSLREGHTGRTWAQYWYLNSSASDGCQREGVARAKTRRPSEWDDWGCRAKAQSLIKGNLIAFRGDWAPSQGPWAGEDYGQIWCRHRGQPSMEPGTHCLTEVIISQGAVHLLPSTLFRSDCFPFLSVFLVCQLYWDAIYIPHKPSI